MNKCHFIHDKKSKPLNQHLAIEVHNHELVKWLQACTASVTIIVSL